MASRPPYPGTPPPSAAPPPSQRYPGTQNSSGGPIRFPQQSYTVRAFVFFHLTCIENNNESGIKCLLLGRVVESESEVGVTFK